MNEITRVLVHVKDAKHEVIDFAIVEGRIPPIRDFRHIPYNKRLNCHVLDMLEPAPFEIRIKDPRGVYEERYKITLMSGDNHIQVMLKKPGMMSFDSGVETYSPHERMCLFFLSDEKKAG